MAKKPNKKTGKKASRKQLQIAAATMRARVPMSDAEAARGAQQQQMIAFEVENPSDEPVHVWTSRRGYDFDASTRVLTLYLTDQTPDLPPGITMISDHPHTPEQVEVQANSKATIEVSVPATIRRRVPGEGFGMSFIEEPIEQIDRVDIHMQSAPEKVEYLADEKPAEFRKRLRARGDVVQATITPTKTKE